MNAMQILNNNGITQALSMLKQNPMQFLIQRRMNIPRGIAMDNPQAILNHLVQTGQVSQQQINNAYRMAQSLQNMQ